jgi:antitoxin component YwqK of YwqJK toxin-antitoxin module
MLGDKRHGRWTFWYANGVKQLEGDYEEDKKAGLWVKWHVGGTKASEGGFLDGKMHGKWTDWHVNGKKGLESYWVMGKRDGQWKHWNAEGALEKTMSYDNQVEEDKGYSIHTDLETKQLIRDIQRRGVHRTWENLVGRSVARLVKPWHIACWTLIFIPILGLIKDKTPWRSAALAAVLAFLLTGLLAWGFEGKRRYK